MSERRTTVITTYGHNEIIDKLAISVFTGLVPAYGNDSDAETYCKTINSLKLEGESWVYAQIVSENTPYELATLFRPKPVTFDVVCKLDNRSIQKVLREVDSRDLAMALRGETQEIKDKVFANMSKRAAEMLEQDMDCIGSVKMQDVECVRKRILDVIGRLERIGEINYVTSKGE